MPLPSALRLPCKEQLPRQRHSYTSLVNPRTMDRLVSAFCWVFFVLYSRFIDLLLTRTGPFSNISHFSSILYTSKGDYVCKDCGYVFTKGPKAWAELPDNYGCPPCGAPKRRFKKVPKGSASGKVEVKKSWF